MQSATVISISEEQERIRILEIKAFSYASESQSKNTLRAYKSDWADFESWCGRNDLASLPAHPQTVCLYLTDLASRCKTSTIKRRIASIAYYHVRDGQESPRENPAVKAVLMGIRRTKGTSQKGRNPILKDDLEKMVKALPDSLIGTRDKAILLLGFFSACRRSEIVGLDVDDLTFAKEGFILLICKSKTDQEMEGREVGIPFASNPELCPVLAVKEWLKASEIDCNAVFRGVNRHGQVHKERLSDKTVALIVKRTAKKAGLDSTMISAHSLRSGFCTEAAIHGVEERILMKQTGHKSERVVRGYIKEASVFTNNGAKAVVF